MTGMIWIWAGDASGDLLLRYNIMGCRKYGNMLQCRMDLPGYYQPEAYVPSSDTYIAKDSSINEEIEKLRLSATASLTERRDVVVSAMRSISSPKNSTLIR